MTRGVVFIDSSIMCNLVPVPGRDQDRTEVQSELRERLAKGQQFILPITAVIETGNFVAQLSNGRLRRETATRIADILRLICEGKAPWVLHDLAWNKLFLEAFLEGGGTQVDYIQHAMAQVGAGDLCLLTERQHYVERTGVPASIWTLDEALRAFA